jgi:hypothetical protein
LDFDQIQGLAHPVDKIQLASLIRPIDLPWLITE